MQRTFLTALALILSLCLIPTPSVVADETDCSICKTLRKENRASYTHFIANVDGVTNPRLLHKTPPIFPEKARAKRLEGAVRLQALISSQGKVVILESISCAAGKDCPRKNCKLSCEDLGLEEAAIEAVSQWTYEPATKNREPVATHFMIYVTFELH